MKIGETLVITSAEGERFILRVIKVTNKGNLLLRPIGKEDATPQRVTIAKERK